jgi:hypothetical protein
MFVIVEVCDDDLSVNLITSDVTEARKRLICCAIENELELSNEVQDQVMRGSITGFRDSADGEYRVELLCL